MFNIGDKVRALPRAPYSVTTNGWIGYVVATSETERPIMQHTDIKVTDHVTGNFWVRSEFFELVKPSQVKENKEEKCMVNVKEIITDEEREALLKNMRELLSEYDYNYTDKALNKIIDTWATNKADLILAFKKHPNYLKGKFMIAFSHNFNREIDLNALELFKRWLFDFDTCMALREFMPEEMRIEVIDYGRKLPDAIYRFLCDLPNMTEQYINDDIVEKLNIICPDVHAHKGQKMSRVINKILSYIGYNKLPDYNREFAKYADALNPLQITRHTVISVNPLDYLTMSFGNSWASCHTIDKTNKRGMPNSYEGMYSSGTVSYMLDKPSMVFYTVDASYNGNDFWNEPKINRQMFHWGEEKLVQGRLYPQDNDYNNGAYTPYREIVQNIISELFGFPNLWTVSKGTGAADRYVISKGTHYRDYANYDNCTLSRPKGSENDEYITVGHDPICIYCGREHMAEENISCCVGTVTCTHCGCVIDEEDVNWVNGEPYCEDCVSYCHICESYFVGEGTETRDSYCVCPECLEDLYVHCDGCGEYVRSGNASYVESEEACFCNDCLEKDFAICAECGEYHRFNNMVECAERLLCRDCAEENSAEAV